MYHPTSTRREITRILALEIQASWSYDDPDYTLDDARRANEDGFTFETPGALGGWVRTEGARLDETTLASAFADATVLAQRGDVV